MINTAGADVRRREKDPAQPACAAAAHGIAYTTTRLRCMIGPATRPEGLSKEARDRFMHTRGSSENTRCVAGAWKVAAKLSRGVFQSYCAGRQSRHKCCTCILSDG